MSVLIDGGQARAKLYNLNMRLYYLYNYGASYTWDEPVSGTMVRASIMYNCTTSPTRNLIVSNYMVQPDVKRTLLRSKYGDSMVVENTNLCAGAREEQV